MIAPTRAAALARLETFVPRMGRDYAAGRNADPGPGERRDVSELSPHIRHRLITEEEVLHACLAHHTPSAAFKFVQEVFWRSYWKGYLELRPRMWADYKAAVARADPAVAADAMAGRTGIACFDAWVAELKTEGYLHNHVRMWFASIWIFTLRLPWVLGAEFFLAHLKDADAASNTLSWRWVAGIQTPGRNYLARAANIARHTDGRFNPVGELDEKARPLTEPGPPPPGGLPPADPTPAGRVALLLHEDDLSFWPEGCEVVGVGGICFPQARSIFGASPVAESFTVGAVEDGVRRAAMRVGISSVGHRREGRRGSPGSADAASVRIAAGAARPGERPAAAATMLEPEGVAEWARALGVTDVVMPWSPVGWTADHLAGLPGIRLHRLRREWDGACWPLARAGFFGFGKKIPGLLERFGLVVTAQTSLPL